MTLRDPSSLSVDEILAQTPGEGHTYVPPMGYVGLLWCGGCYSPTLHTRILTPTDATPGVWLECTSCGCEVGPSVQEVDPQTGLPFPHGQRRVVPAFPPETMRLAAEEARARGIRTAAASGAELTADGSPRPEVSRG